MVNKSLKNKKIINSAGASGIGLATAKVCLSRGAYVYLCDIDNKSLNKLNKNPLINKRLFKYNCDASDESQVLDLFKKISKKTKKIDALINNVGVAGPTGSLEKLRSKDWEKTIQVDVNSHFYFTKKSIPLLKKSKNGSIINISSIAGLVGLSNCSAYNASKGGVRLLTKNIAVEYGEFNVRCNSIHPGFMATNMNDPKVVAERGRDINALTDAIPLKRMGTAEDIANCALFLASDESVYVTGSEYTVDAGLTAK